MAFKEELTSEPEPGAEQQPPASFYENVFGPSYTIEKIRQLEELQGYIEISVTDIETVNKRLIDLSATETIRWVSHQPLEEIPHSGQIQFIIVVDPFDKYLFIRQDNLDQLYDSNQTQPK